MDPHFCRSGGESIPGHLRWHSRVLGLIGGQRGASGPHRLCRSTALPARFCPEGSLITSLTSCMIFFLFLFSIFNCFFKKIYGLMNGPSLSLTKVHWPFPAPSMDTKNPVLMLAVVHCWCHWLWVVRSASVSECWSCFCWSCFK